MLRPGCLYATPTSTMSASSALMAAKGTITPPKPYTAKLRASRRCGDASRHFTPRSASGMSATMIRALYMMAASIAEAGVATFADTTPSPTDPRLRLWRGDITTLAADAIVNAANSGMTGCWAPLHYCIDNAIHTFAGVQLRAACANLMAAQGHPEPTSQAKVTDGYNLPARYVIHTVGPIANGRPTDTHRRQLAECYRACLDATAKAGLSSIAFCCISTGVFGFPQEEAASIAVATVRRWLNEHPDVPMTVVFNVFSETDESLYRPLLGL